MSNILLVQSSDISRIKEIAQLAMETSVKLASGEKQRLKHSIMESIDSSLTIKNRIYYKFKDRETIKGYILILEYWNLCHLFVDPDFHGKGVGKALLQSGISECQKKSDKDYIRVNSSANAEKFYRKYGFTDCDSDKDLKGSAIPLKLNF